MGFGIPSGPKLTLEPALDGQLRSPSLPLGHRPRSSPPHLDRDVVRRPALSVLARLQIFVSGEQEPDLCENLAVRTRVVVPRDHRCDVADEMDGVAHDTPPDRYLVLTCVHAAANAAMSQPDE